MVLQTKFFKPKRIMSGEEVELRTKTEGEKILENFIDMNDFLFLEIEKPLVMTRR